MANPQFVTLTTAGTWYKVASSVTTGWIYLVKTIPNYFYTYRLAGDTAPVGTVTDELPFEGSYQAEIDSSDLIDVYVKCDEDNGSLVVTI